LWIVDSGTAWCLICVGTNVRTSDLKLAMESERSGEPCSSRGNVIMLFISYWIDSTKETRI
jgi:hypothetical protein